MLGDKLFYIMTMVFLILCYPAYLVLFQSHQGPLKDGEKIVRLWKPVIIRNILIGLCVLVTLIHFIAKGNQPRPIEEQDPTDPAIVSKNILEDDSLAFEYSLKEFRTEDKSYEAFYSLVCTPSQLRENEKAVLYLDSDKNDMNLNGSVFEKDFSVKPGERPSVKVRLVVEGYSKDFYSDFDPSYLIKDFYPTLDIGGSGITRTEEQLHAEWVITIKESADPELVYTDAKLFALVNEELGDYQELHTLLEEGSQNVSLTLNIKPEDKLNFYLQLSDTADNRHIYRLVAPRENMSFAEIRDAEDKLILSW